MKFGIAFGNTGPFVDAAAAADLASQAEQHGFDSIWTVEHVVFPVGYESTYPYAASGKMPATPNTPIPDPLIWLTYVAAATTRLRLGTGILILPQRNPLVLAKEIATLDHLSGGRVELGVGVGWLKEEFEALGVPWPRRGRRTDESIEAMRTLWSGTAVSYEGELVSFSQVSSYPKPANGTVPITVGGHSEAAARRAGRLGDGFFPAMLDESRLPGLLDIMRESAVANGRDPDSVEIMTNHRETDGDDAIGAVEAKAALGVSRLLVPAFSFWGENGPEAMAAFAERVIRPTASM